MNELLYKQENKQTNELIVNCTVPFRSHMNIGLLNKRANSYTDLIFTFKYNYIFISIYFELILNYTKSKIL